MTRDSTPSLDKFLTAPSEDIADVAPASMIYSVSGTRRSAALAGKYTRGEEYVRWSRERMMVCLDLIFDHGVEHIIMPVITPSQFNEATPSYREHLWQWLDKGLSGSEALADYQERGWRVRIPFGDQLPRLQEASERVKRGTVEEGSRTLWVFVVPEHNLLWKRALARLQRLNAGSVAEAVRLLYGADIPPATLYLDFGKPIVSPDLLPPFLIGVLQCYWYQQPGYSLNERKLRTILYDYAYVRPTWQEDKRGRAEQALEHRDKWNEERIIGLGRRLGPFWYPAPPSPAEIEDE